MQISHQNNGQNFSKKPSVKIGQELHLFIPSFIFKEPIYYSEDINSRTVHYNLNVLDYFAHLERREEELNLALHNSKFE